MGLKAVLKKVSKDKLDDMLSQGNLFLQEGSGSFRVKLNKEFVQYLHDLSPKLLTLGEMVKFVQDTDKYFLKRVSGVNIKSISQYRDWCKAQGKRGKKLVRLHRRALGKFVCKKVPSKPGASEPKASTKIAPLQENQSQCCQGCFKNDCWFLYKN